MGYATLYGPLAVDKERFVAAERNSAKKGGAERRMRLLKARGSAELKKVAFNSATQGVWLENRKVGFQVVGKDRRKGTVGKVRRGERRRKASDRRKRTQI